MAYARLLSGQNDVTVDDKSQDKVDAIERQSRGNRKGSGVSVRPISDSPIRATTDGKSTYADADYVIIAVPTDSVEGSDELDCSAVEEVIRDVLEATEHALIIVKSTVPVGFTWACAQKHNTDRIIYNPEFLREASADEDCRRPDRIVIGTVAGTSPAVEEYASILRDSTDNPETLVLYMTASEAEAVKLFSNTYLAMRVAFFNEMDSFAEATDLDPGAVINGVCSDPRIGDYYNAPSFGYGGTCLPKDVRQLGSQVKDIHGDLISAIDASNRSRLELTIDRIISRLEPSFFSENTRHNESENGSSDPDKNIVAGIYCLSMEPNSDNYRHSCILKVLEGLRERGVTTVIYEPALSDKEQILGCDVIRDLDTFKKTSDLIITNRYDASLDDVREKVYTRDMFFGKQDK